MKRIIDILLSSIALLIFCVPLLLIAIGVKLSSSGPVLYWSARVGRGNRLFRMPKFRTMVIGTPEVATHLLAEPGRYLTPLGRILRKTSLDELPQILAILRGDMSIVGPRPALFNQKDLIGLRTARGVHELTPGLTGWAQINGRDELPITVKVEFDEYYLRNRSVLFDAKIILLTFMKVLGGEAVSH